MMEGQSLQRIAAAVTPAVMVSACGLFALGLDNQIARITNRLRDLAKEARGLTAAIPRREVIRLQIAILDRRHDLLSWALRLNYAALFTFVATSVIYLAEAFIGFTTGLPVITFTLGVVLLGAMAAFALASTQLSRESLRHELSDVR